jgi:hypothetical protein
MQMMTDQQFPASYTGLPYLGAIDPVDDELYLNAIPTSEENGLVYQYWYDKDLSLSLATDTFPFSDAVFRAMIPVVADLWKLEREHEFNGDWSRLNFGRACRFLNETQQRSSYQPTSVKPNAVVAPYNG